MSGKVVFLRANSPPINRGLLLWFMYEQIIPVQQALRICSLNKRQAFYLFIFLWSPGTRAAFMSASHLSHSITQTQKRYVVRYKTKLLPLHLAIYRWPSGLFCLFVTYKKSCCFICLKKKKAIIFTRYRSSEKCLMNSDISADGGN